MILSKRRSVYISIDAFLLNFICFESEWGVLQTEYYSLFLVITCTFTKRSQYQEKQNVSNYFLLFLISNKKIKKLKAAVNLIFQERVFHKLEENNILVGDIDIRVNLGAKLFSGSNLYRNGVEINVNKSYRIYRTCDSFCAGAPGNKNWLTLAS